MAFPLSLLNDYSKPMLRYSPETSVQQEKRRRVFWAGLSVKDGEPIYRYRAIKNRVFHGTFLSLGLGKQLKLK
jgi:hypothetical protein